jgi:hypothetical protein
MIYTSMLIACAMRVDAFRSAYLGAWAGILPEDDNGNAIDAACDGGIRGLFG